MLLKNRHKRNINIFINFFLGPLMFLWLSYSIYHQLADQPGLALSWSTIRSSFTRSTIWLLIAVIGLMLVNWSLEAVKWKLSVQQIQPVSYTMAFKAILSGVAFSVTTPNRVGEYLGRILYMNEGNRLKAISLTITGSVSQLIITLLMGLIGLIGLQTSIEGASLVSAPWVKLLIAGTAIMLAVLTLFYFRIPWLVKAIDRLPGKHRFNWLIRALEEYNATLLIQLLSLSATRFLVFVVQYYLLFRLFNVELGVWEVWSTVSVSFLVMAAVPTIALFTDLGLRGEVILQLVGLFSPNKLGIGLTAIGIWAINLIIPALAGSLLILSIRGIFKNKYGEAYGTAEEGPENQTL